MDRQTKQLTHLRAKGNELGSLEEQLSFKKASVKNKLLTEGIL